jgi:hypothetical protein
MNREEQPFNLGRELNRQNLRLAASLYSKPGQVGLFKDGGQVKGGMILGPGTGKSDSIDKELEVNSFILPVEVVQAIGPDKLQMMIDKFREVEDDDDNGTIPAKVSNGEFEVPADVVEKTGPDYWNALIQLATGKGAQPKMSEHGEMMAAEGGYASLRNGFPDYGYGDRYQSPNDPNPPRPKGRGFYGEVKRPDGGISTELGVDTGRGEIPAMVPGMTRNEMNSVLSARDGQAFPDSVYQKADSYAAFRLLNGKSPFAGVNDKQELMPVDNDPNVSNALRAPNDPPYHFAEGGLAEYEAGGVVQQTLRGRAGLAPKPPTQMLTLQPSLKERANAAPKPSGLPQTIGNNLGGYDSAIAAARIGPRQTGLPDLPVLGPRASEGAIKDALHNAGTEAGIATGLAYDVLAAPEIAKGRQEALQGLKAKAGFAPDSTPFKYAQGGLVQRFGEGGLAKSLRERASQVDSVNYGRPPANDIPRKNLNLQQRAALAPQPTGPIQPRTLAPEPTPQNLVNRAAQAPQPTGPVQPINLQSDLQRRAALAPQPTGPINPINLTEPNTGLQARAAASPQSTYSANQAFTPSQLAKMTPEQLAFTGKPTTLGNNLGAIDQEIYAPGRNAFKMQSAVGLGQLAPNVVDSQTVGNVANQLASQASPQYRDKLLAAFPPQTGAPRPGSLADKAGQVFGNAVEALTPTPELVRAKRPEAQATQVIQQPNQVDLNKDYTYTGNINGQPYFAPKILAANTPIPQADQQFNRNIESLYDQGRLNDYIEGTFTVGQGPQKTLAPNTLPFNSNTPYNPQGGKLTQAEIDDAYARADLQNSLDYQRTDLLGRAQRDNAVLGSSGSSSFNPKTGERSSNYSQQGFTPDVQTLQRPDAGEQAYKQGALGLEREKFEFEKSQANKPKYSLSNGIIVQQEGEGALDFNASAQQNMQRKKADISRAWNMLLADPSQEQADNPDAIKSIEAQKQAIKEWLLAHDPDRAIKYFQGQGI